MVGQPTVVIPCGHLVIDLSQHKLPIEFLLKRFNTNPSTRWPPDEDAGDDSDPGDEPPPWKKRPRPSDWPLRLLGFQIDAWRGWEEQTPCTNLQERDRTGEPSGGSVT